MLNQNEERLQKVLARAGIASRRACETLIEAGRVKVNGKIVTELGVKINPAQDKVSVDDHPVAIRPSLETSKTYLLLNKPAGYLSTVTDPQGRPTIMDLVDTDLRLYPVGRLDMDTEGLLILTNDGAFANTLMHPRYGLEKEYLALLEGIPAAHELERMRRGVPIPVENDRTDELEQYITQPARVEIVRNEGSNTLVRFVIREGKKRQIRLMAQFVNHAVLELTRVAYGPLRLGNLATGKYRSLSKAEVKGLLDAAAAPVAPFKKGSRGTPGIKEVAAGDVGRSSARTAEGTPRPPRPSPAAPGPAKGRSGSFRPDRAQPARGHSSSTGGRPQPTNTRSDRSPAAPTGGGRSFRSGRPAPVNGRRSPGRAGSSKGR